MFTSQSIVVVFADRIEYLTPCELAEITRAQGWNESDVDRVLNPPAGMCAALLASGEESKLVYYPDPRAPITLH